MRTLSLRSMKIKNPKNDFYLGDKLFVTGEVIEFEDSKATEILAIYPFLEVVETKVEVKAEEKKSTKTK